MKNVAERVSSPTAGNAFGYFIILWAVHSGYIGVDNQVEAVAFMGAIATHVALEMRSIIRWVGNIVSSIINKYFGGKNE